MQFNEKIIKIACNLISENFVQHLQGLPPNMLSENYEQIAVIVYYSKMPAKNAGERERRWKLKLQTYPQCASFSAVVDCIRMEASNPRYNSDVGVLSSFAVQVRTHPSGFGPVVFKIANLHNWSPEGDTEKKLQLKEVMKIPKDAGSFVMKQPKVVVVDGRETAVTAMYLTIVASQGNQCRVEKVINLGKD